MDFALQYLKHGKALCGSVFGTFVETFNRLVDFHANLKGDGDVSADGRITVDRADPAHPVIRFDATGPSGGDSGGGDSGGGSESKQSAFGLSTEKDEEGNVTGRTVVNCYFMAGNVTCCDGSSWSVGADSGIIYVKFNCAGATTTLESVAVAADLSALAADMKKADSIVYPLYAVDGATVIDLRTMPRLQVFESLEAQS